MSTAFDSWKQDHLSEHFHDTFNAEARAKQTISGTVSHHDSSIAHAFQILSKCNRENANLFDKDPLASTILPQDSTAKASGLYSFGLFGSNEKREDKTAEKTHESKPGKRGNNP